MQSILCSIYIDRQLSLRLAFFKGDCKVSRYWYVYKVPLLRYNNFRHTHTFFSCHHLTKRFNEYFIWWFTYFFLFTALPCRPITLQTTQQVLWLLLLNHIFHQFHIQTYIPMYFVAVFFLLILHLFFNL